MPGSQRKRRRSRVVSLEQDWSSETKRIAWILNTQFMNNRTEMAQAIGFTNMVVSRVVGGKRPPSARLLKAIIDRLAISAEWLLHGRGQPSASTAADPSGNQRVP